MTKYTIVIADDEEIERKALRLLLQKEFPEIAIVAVACNGMELVSMVQQHQPDMAIVDVNMPGINGIDAIDLLCTKNCRTRFIINTAYDDFAYVQRALSLKIDAYILKPEKRGTTIQTIRTLCRQIDVARENRHSQQKMQALFSRVQSVMENEIMYSLFIGEPAQENFETYCEMHNLQFEAGTVVALIPVAGNGRFRNQDKAELRSALDGALGNSCAYLASITEANISLLLFVEKGSQQEQQKWIGDVLRVAVDKLNRTLQLSLRAGVGGIYFRFQQLPGAYQESLMALMNPAADGISFYRSESTQHRESAELLLQQFREGNLQGIGSEIIRLRLQQNAPRAASALWQALQESLNRETVLIPGLQQLLEHTARQLAVPEQDTDVLSFLQDGLYRLASALKPQENGGEDSSYVDKALRYIEEHYAEDISLDLVAERIGISPFYLSRLFRAERGENFVDYLTGVRMQTAVRLAKETRLSIREIANRTGYGSPTYFCRVFKKYTGSTIGEIREQNRKKQF